MQLSQIPMNLGFPLARAHAMVEKSRIIQALQEVLGPEGYDIENLVKGRGGGGGGGGSTLGNNSIYGTTHGSFDDVSSRPGAPREKVFIPTGTGNSDDAFSGDALSDAQLYLEEVKKFTDENADDKEFDIARANLQFALDRLDQIKGEFESIKKTERYMQLDERIFQFMTQAVYEASQEDFDFWSGRLLQNDGDDDSTPRKIYVSHMASLLEKVKAVNEQTTGDDGLNAVDLQAELQQCKQDVWDGVYQDIIGRQKFVMATSVLERDRFKFNTYAEHLLEFARQKDKEECASFTNKMEKHLSNLEAIDAQATSSGMDTGLQAQLKECQESVLESTKRLGEKDTEIAQIKAKMNDTDTQLEAAKAEATASITRLEAKEAEIARLNREKEEAVGGTPDIDAKLKLCETQKQALFAQFTDADNTKRLLELEVNYPDPRLHNVFQNVADISDEVKFVQFFVEYLTRQLININSIEAGERIKNHGIVLERIKKRNDEWVENMMLSTKLYKLAKEESRAMREKITKKTLWGEVIPEDVARSFTGVRESFELIYKGLENVDAEEIDEVKADATKLTQDVMVTMTHVVLKDLPPGTQFKRFPQTEEDPGVSGTDGTEPSPIASPWADSGVEESKGSGPPLTHTATWSVPDETYIEQMMARSRSSGGDDIYPDPQNHFLSKYLTRIMENDPEVKNMEAKKKITASERQAKKRIYLLKSVLSGEEDRVFRFLGDNDIGNNETSIDEVRLTKTQTYSRYKELRFSGKIPNMISPERQVRLFLLVIHNEGLISSGDGIVHIKPHDESAADLSDLFPWL